MVDGAFGLNKWKNREKINRLRRIKFEFKRTKTKVSSQLVWKKIQNLALKLYQTATLWSVTLFIRLHEKLFHKSLYKIWWIAKQGAKQIGDHARPLHRDDMWCDKITETMLLGKELQGFV